MTMVTVSQLKDQIGKPGPHPILFCVNCMAEYSANAGDYWDLPKNMTLECECGEPFKLVIKRTVFEEIE